MTSSASRAVLDVQGIADAVASCPSVLGLAPHGVVVELKSYLPGRRVGGIRVVNGVIEVHVVARWVQYLPDVAEEVRAAIGAVVGSQPVTVFIDDIGRSGDADGDGGR